MLIENKIIELESYSVVVANFSLSLRFLISIKIYAVCQHAAVVARPFVGHSACFQFPDLELVQNLIGHQSWRQS